MPRGRNWVAGEQLAQVDNRDPFAAPVWRSPVYRTPEAVIMVVQLLRLIWRVLWFALTHPLRRRGGRAGRRHLARAGLARHRRPRRDGRRRAGRAAGHAAGLVRPVRGGAGAGLVAVVVLPAPVEGRDDPGRARPGLPRPADAPGARPGAPGRGGGPGAGRPGDRAGTGRLRGQGREPGARVRRPAVPGPRRRARHGAAGAGPRRHPGRPDPRPADHRGGGPGRAAGRPVRGRLALAAAAGCDACADRRGYRVGEGLGDLVADPGAAARDRGAGGCRCGRWIPSGWSCRSAGPCSTGTPATRPRWSSCWRPRSPRCTSGPGSSAAGPAPSPPRPSSRSWWCWWTSWRS